MTLPTDPRDDQARIPQQSTSTTAEPTAVDTVTRPPRARRWPWIAAAAVVVLAVAGGVTYLAMPSDEDTAADRCQTAITAKLKAPSTVKYGDDVTVTSSDGNFGSYYQVFGTVDAQNGFGAMVRAAYHCKVTHESNGGWLVTESSLAEG